MDLLVKNLMTQFNAHSCFTFWIIRLQKHGVDVFPPGSWLIWILRILYSRSTAFQVLLRKASRQVRWATAGHARLCLLSLITGVVKLQGQETPCQGAISCQHIVVTCCPNSSAQTEHRQHGAGPEREHFTPDQPWPLQKRRTLRLWILDFLFYE